MAGRRLEQRRMNEAAEALGIDETSKATKKKKKATKRKAATTTTRKRAVKAPARKKLMWVIFTGSMREEARFAYEDKAAAEERLETLLNRGKRTYFMQPVKEAIAEVAASDDDDDDAPAEAEAADE